MAKHLIKLSLLIHFGIFSCADINKKNNRNHSESSEDENSEPSKGSQDQANSNQEFQNVGQRSFGVVDPKIFSENKKVIINPVHTQTFKEGVAGRSENSPNMIPQTLNLAFVLNETKCGSLPSYFSEDLITKMNRERKSIEVVSGFLRTSMNISVLDADTKRLPCIIGVSTSEGMARFQDDSGGNAVDYLKSIRLSESQSEWASLMSNQKVKVGVIDTGIDMENDDLNSLVSPLYGSDRVGFDDIPEDILGHGTSIASLLISKNQKQKDVYGMASSNIEILPVKVVPPNGAVLSHQVANGIIHAVNLGAEVINLSLGGQTAGCDVVIGYAIDFAIQRNVFVTIAAGNKGTLVIPARRDTLTSFESTTNPACWGLYFKGAVTVAAMNASYDEKLSSSNFGAAVEMIAPGEGMNTYDLGGRSVVKRGTSFAAPIVAGAAAMIIAAHKQKKWSYTPWLIEDILLNSSPSRKSLEGKIYKGKFLDLAKTANYLDSLAQKSEVERLAEPYNDPSLGDGYRYADNGTDRLVRLELLTSTQLINEVEKSAVRARAYYASGSYYIVSDKVKWSVSNPNLLRVDAYGAIYPTSQAVGKSVIISGEFEGFTSSISVGINSISDVIGEYAQIEELSIKHEKNTNTTAQFSLLARFNDGAVRNLSQSATWNSSDENFFRHKGMWSTKTRNWIPENPRPVAGEFAFSPEVTRDTTVEVRASYRGNTVISNFPLKPISYRVGFMSIGTEGTGGGYWNHTGDKGTSEINYEVVKGLKYNFVGRALYHDRRSVDTLEVQPGTFISGYDEIKFKRFGTNDTPTSSLSTEYAELWIHPDLKPGNYEIRFESDPVYPSTLDQKFSVKINLKIEVERVTSVKVVSQDFLPWGDTYSLLQVSGVYSTGLVKWMPLSDFDVSFLNASGAELEKVWFKQQYEMQAYLKIYEESLKGSQLNIRVKHKKSELSANKIVQVKALSNFAVNRIANIPQISNAPAPRTRGTDCTTERKNLRPFAGGVGTQTSPFLICNYEQIKEISKLSASSIQGHTGLLFFKLADHIDASITASGERFEPIKTFKDSVFDGDNYDIQNLFVDEKETNLRSFFDSGRWYSIENLVFRNANVRGKNNVGILFALLGNALRKIENISFIDGTVEGGYYVGAIAGNINGTNSNISIQKIRIYKTRVNGSFSTGSIAGTVNHTGGSMKLKDIFSTATVSNEGLSSNCVGGLVGSSSFGYDNSSLQNYPDTLSNLDSMNGLFILDSLFHGTVTQLSPGTSGSMPSGSVGGIIGCASYTTIVDVENRGAVTSPVSKVGGIVGKMMGLDSLHYGFLYRVKNSGNVIAGVDPRSVSDAGGIVGQSLGGIYANIESTAQISGLNQLGGILGKVTNYTTVHDVNFSSQLVNTSGTGKGAIIGKMEAVLTPTNVVISPNTKDLKWTDGSLQAFGN